MSAVINTFLEGLNLNLSDYTLKNTQLRIGMNIRILDLDSSSYVITNIRGTEIGFTLSPGFVPLAAKQFDNVIYILSINPDTSFCELGSFGSPGTGYSPIINPLRLWSIKTAGDYGLAGHTYFTMTASPKVSDLMSTPLVMPINTTLQLSYTWGISDVGASAFSGSIVYTFYSSSTILYTKTFTFSGSGDIAPSTTIETHLFSTGNLTSVTLQVFKTTGSAAILVTPLLQAIETGGIEDIYRPFSNLDGGPFDTTVFGYSLGDFVKMELQAEYDGSINVILFEKDVPPRIINSGFLRSDSGTLIISPLRPSDASSNQYTSNSVDEQTKLILSSSVVLQVALSSISSGGQLKYGTYIYYFAYQTEDFNNTDIIGQSGLCAIFTGLDAGHIKGGLSSQTTDKKVTLTLSRIDTNYTYLKIYALYSSGEQGLEQQLLEFTVPTQITGSTMTITHSGFEEVSVISQDVVNVNFEAIDAAASGAQINGYLMAAGIREQSVDFSQFKAASLMVTATAASPHAMSYTGSLSAVEGYDDPTNIYNYTSLFLGEAYAYRMVWILAGGVLTPPYPVTGIDYATGGNPTNSDGIVRLPFPSSSNISYSQLLSQIYARGVKFDISALPSPAVAAAIGFFFVRAERNPSLLAQGYLVPTTMVPPIEYLNYPDWFSNNQAGTEITSYRLVPSVDNMMESFNKDTSSGGGDQFAVDVTHSNKFLNNMPIAVNHFGAGSSSTTANLTGYVDNYPQNAYAFISPDAIANESKAISIIGQRQGMYARQIAKVSAHVTGEVAPLGAFDGGGTTVHVGLIYDTFSLSYYSSPVTKSIDYCDFIPNESFTAGTVPSTFGTSFGSKVSTGYTYLSSAVTYRVSLGYNSYFGMKITALTDATPSATNPRGGNARIPAGAWLTNWECAGLNYHNYDSIVPFAFLVNIYPSSSLFNLTDLYPDTDSLSYKQIGQRYIWTDVISSTVTVYSGDCFIGKTYRKLYQSTYRNPLTPADNRNMDSGLVISMICESNYNTNLRNPIRYDASETEDRSFYPYQSRGDYPSFRTYRYPETLECSLGYNPGLGSKIYTPQSSLDPVIRTNFFSRVAFSGKHIPNAFKNGYRSFTGNNFQDYDSSMGAIVDVLNHQNQLLIIFQHGVGIVSVEQRVETSKDSSGPIVAEPNGVLPPNCGVPSRTLGCQNPLSICQSPQAVYAVDVDKRRIWQMTDQVKAISDEKVSAFLENNPIVNPRTGYDYKYSEVLFTTDNWTLVYREGMEKFTSFYSFLPSYYASRGSQLYGFDGSEFEKHNSAITHRIYGNLVDSYVEFVVPVHYNEANQPITNVYDVFQIVSNEVVPKSVEFFTYANDSKRLFTLDSAACKQYCKVIDQISPFTEISPFNYQDQRFIFPIPTTTVYNGSLDNWEVDSRMRHFYLIVRVTYNTDLDLQLMEVITKFRLSRS